MLKEAGRTSVLSKRWIHLWMGTTNLNFDATKVSEELGTSDITRKESPILCKRERHKYIRWVDAVLKLHNSLALDEFRICFDLNNSRQKHIDESLRHAFARKVQWLELNLFDAQGFPGDYSRTHTFPPGLVGLRSGKSTDKHPASSFDFKSLRALILRRVNVTEEVLQSFLHNCPLFERLVVHGSHDLVNLEILDHLLP